MIRHVKTRRGVRILQHGVVLSEVLAEPGPTHSIADVLAAAVDALSPGPNTALLGFQAGGLLAPLRALRAQHRVDAVDIDDQGVGLFQQLCGAWCGSVRFHHADALQWTAARRLTFDLIIDDLSVGSADDVVKPEFVWNKLPKTIRHALKPRGVAVFNLLRPQGWSWQETTEKVIANRPPAHVIRFKSFENRIVITGCANDSAHSISRMLRQRLRQIRSDLASDISVHRFH